jgi:geranylgeranyl pyrophosphate synthase
VILGPKSLSWRSGEQQRRVSAGMRRVEQRLHRVADAYPGSLADSAAATLGAGGKRVRPLLVLLCARRSAPLDDAVVHAAAAVELLHMATLVHDDVLDGAALRRGRPTVVSESGAAVATSVGNYLFAGAFAEVVASGDPRAVARLSDVAAGLSEGEVHQMREAYDVHVSPESYLRRCTLKTADLFAVSCRLGAQVTGVEESSVVQLEDFGRLLGLAFQIFDDILDFTGDESRTGKKLGTDVRDGTVTLPLVYALEASPELAPLVSLRDKSADQVAEVVAEVCLSGALARARESALAYIAAARERLAACRADVEKDLLGELAGQVVDRYS